MLRIEDLSREKDQTGPFRIQGMRSKAVSVEPTGRGRFDVFIHNSPRAIDYLLDQSLKSLRQSLSGIYFQHLPIKLCVHEHITHFAVSFSPADDWRVELMMHEDLDEWCWPYPAWQFREALARTVKCFPQWRVAYVGSLYEGHSIGTLRFARIRGKATLREEFERHAQVAEQIILAAEQRC